MSTNRLTFGAVIVVAHVARSAVGTSVARVTSWATRAHHRSVVVHVAVTLTGAWAGRTVERSSLSGVTIKAALALLTVVAFGIVFTEDTASIAVTSTRAVVVAAAILRFIHAAGAVTWGATTSITFVAGFTDFAELSSCMMHAVAAHSGFGVTVI